MLKQFNAAMLFSLIFMVASSAACAKRGANGIEGRYILSLAGPGPRVVCVADISGLNLDAVCRDFQGSESTITGTLFLKPDGRVVGRFTWNVPGAEVFDLKMVEGRRTRRNRSIVGILVKTLSGAGHQPLITTFPMRFDR